MEKKWWKESVVYQIYPRSFCDSNGDGIGDIKGITSKLDYLKGLGIDVIWLSPVYQSPNDDNGYDISDYQAIMEEFGTMEDFDEMLAATHERGMKLVMDLVVNHTSDEHRWFVESRKSVDNPYRDYYIWRPAKDGKEPNNWGSCFSGPAWEYDQETEMYYLHLFSKKQPDLNWDNPSVREEVFQMMNWWIDKGVDGFRMDVISLISKKPDLPDGVPGINGYASFNEPANGPHVHEYLQEMREKVLNRADTITVGECSGVTLEEAKKYARSDGKELNMVFQFEHMDVDADGTNKWSAKKMDLRDLKEVMTRWQKGLEEIAWNSLFWENHDQPRSVSRFGNDGEYWEASAKMLATCLHMMQGTPYIYQGQELGMTNVPFETIEDFRDLDSINAYYELTGQGVFSKEEMMQFLRYKSRDNARTPFQWNDKENAGFTDGTPWIMVNPNYTKINAEEQLEREDSVLNYYKNLIQLRKEHEIIVYGTYDLLLPDSKEIYAYTRTLGEKKLLVVCSFTAEQTAFEMPEEFLKGEVLIHNYEGPCGFTESGSMMLKPYEAFVVMVYSYHFKKKPQLQKRLDHEKDIKFKSYVSFYKSIVDQDRSAVVICNLKHEIIYMNPAAVHHYEKWGGDKLIGESLLQCHNLTSREKIQQVVDWFAADQSHNIVYTFHNEKQNKDVYMVALRDTGELIGYYEKHEYRNTETMKFYDLW